MAHTCHAAGCIAPTKPEMFMCKRHWFMLPKAMRDAVWRHYRPGQCDDKTISKAYSKAAQDAVKYLADKEGQPPSEVRKALLVYLICEAPDPPKPKIMCKVKYL